MLKPVYRYSWKCSDIIAGFIKFITYKSQFCNIVPAVIITIDKSVISPAMNTRSARFLVALLILLVLLAVNYP